MGITVECPILPSSEDRLSSKRPNSVGEDAKAIAILAVDGKVKWSGCWKTHWWFWFYMTSLPLCPQVKPQALSTQKDKTHECSQQCQPTQTQRSHEMVPSSEGGG